MSRKKRPARLFFIAVIGILLYFIVFPYPLGKEIVAKPAWAESVAQPSPGAVPNAGPVEDVKAAPFRLGSTFGFVSSSGDFLHTDTVLHQVALSARNFVNYTRLGTDWILQDQNGARVSSFSGDGYPLLSPNGDRVFNVKSDLSGIIEMDSTGDTLWARDFPGIMTSISLNGDYLSVGLLNGTLLILNREGFPILETKPSGSRISAIFATAVNAEGSVIAAISGIDPQYLNVLRRTSSAPGVIAQVALPTTFRREARMSFSPDGRYVAFEGGGSFGVFDPGRRSLAWLPARGILADMAYAGAGRYLSLVSRTGTDVELSVSRPFCAPVVHASFSARDVYLGGIDGQLLLGWDGMLMRVDVEEL